MADKGLSEYRVPGEWLKKAFRCSVLGVWALKRIAGGSLIKKIVVNPTDFYQSSPLQSLPCRVRGSGTAPKPFSLPTCTRRLHRNRFVCQFGLSERERGREAACLMLEGRSHDETAETLSLGPWTVETYAAGAYKKPGVRSLREIFAMTLGFNDT